MECKQCGTEYEAKRSTSLYCGAACRVKAGRLSVTDKAETLSVTGSVTRPTLEHYQANPDRYARTGKADMLNWGLWMTTDQLHTKGLTANRVPIPGDWDYADVAPVPAQETQA